MSRLSVELTPEQHKKIKAIAAMNGSSIRDYVLQRILPSEDDELTVLNELRKFLSPRIEEAKSGKVISATAESIVRDTLSNKKS